MLFLIELGLKIINLNLKTMKKIILALLLFTSIASYSQLENLTITNIIPMDFTIHNTEGTALTVPVGKIWIVQSGAINTGSYVYIKPIGFSSFMSTMPMLHSDSFPFFLTAGTKLYSSGLLNILEYNAPSTQTGTLALNKIKAIENKIELFPNPTNSKITLNSERDYKIEIYNMQGQMVMKANGNTIDLSNLSNSVYVLKAYDKYEKTTETYKVVKNS
jgi:hypothetical protein